MGGYRGMRCLLEEGEAILHRMNCSKNLQLSVRVMAVLLQLQDLEIHDWYDVISYMDNILTVRYSCDGHCFLDLDQGYNGDLHRTRDGGSAIEACLPGTARIF